MSRENNQADDKANNSDKITKYKDIIVAIIGAIAVIMAAVITVTIPNVGTNRSNNATPTTDDKLVIPGSSTTIETIAFTPDASLPLSTVTSISTIMPTQACPNVQVENLEFFILPGHWKIFPSDLEGNIVLSRVDLGKLNDLLGRANLVNGAGCTCAWRGGTQTDHLQTLNTESHCDFSINISNGSKKDITVYLELTIGSNRPTLFNISIR